MKLIKISTSTVRIYNDNGLHLKHSHPYYHQVQFQLLVRINQYNGCDFCMYTLKGTEVERTWLLDTEWCEKSVVELDSYYDAHTIPKILTIICFVVT